MDHAARTATPLTRVRLLAARVHLMNPGARLALGFTLYLAARWLVLGWVAPIWFSDTTLYAAQYRGGFGGGFLGLARSWGYPFFLWLTGYHWGLAVAVQRVAAAGAWFALATAAGGLFGAAWVRRAVCGLTLLLSLALYAVTWDVMLLSESLSISCLLAMTAAWIRFLLVPGMGLRWLGALALLALPLAGLRDSSVPLLIFFALAAGAGIIFKRGARSAERGEKKRGVGAFVGGLALAGAMLLCALFQHHDAVAGHRSWSNIGNVLSMRVFTKKVFDANSYIADAANIRWMEEHYQLPAAEATARAGRLISQEPPLSPGYRAWLEQTGPRAWSGFMLHHPGWLLGLYHAQPVYGAAPRDYLDVEAEKWQRAHLGLLVALQSGAYAVLGPLLNLRFFNVLLALAAAALGAAWVGALIRRAPRRAAAWLGTLFWLIATSALAALVAIAGDAIECWRHAILGLMTLYVALPLAAGLALETIWRGVKWALARRAAKPMPPPSPPARSAARPSHHGSTKRND